MSLNELIIQDEYRSSDCSIVENFYIPCLEKSIIYKRAVGFFSSTSMAVAAKGLTALIRAGGKIQLVASPQLSDEDIQAIAIGIKQREEIIAEVTRKELEQEFNEVVKHRLACVAWLLSRQLLDIRLAIPKKIREQGIYHEKLGIFMDAEDNIIAFTGSANESSTALIANFECIDVFCSWHTGVKERALRKLDNFNKLWNNKTNNLDVIEFPETAKEYLLNFYPDKKPKSELFFTKEYASKSKLVAEKKTKKYQTGNSSMQKRWRHQIEAKNVFNCLKELDRLIRQAEDDVAEATNTISLHKKTQIIKKILSQARKQAREKLRKFIIDETNQRISQLLSRNPVILEDIQDSLKLQNRKGASEGQTLSVSYAFLATLFNQSTYQLPFIVDSPAISLDLNVRTEVANLIPSLSKQFLAFTISSERQGFIDRLHQVATKEVEYLTLFRKASEMKHIWQDLDSSIFTETTDGVLVEGKEFFEQFDLEDEV
ncbi:hypothetical protein H1P_860017 [Hyella patelloides LEGE 07179]|uniref:Uncharacterized protein n=1 Tax=Hyella patelloides LEGE 07179 TaxID=945734 RepID=A0A563W4S2_9CYAN|nr:hypothetical protein [Hyella patelloides]VEP18691.1 hypothetical protein H1P_860017 [Hyella patelloides LEGE 07179]